MCVPVHMCCMCVQIEKEIERNESEWEDGLGTILDGTGGITNSESFEMFPFTLYSFWAPVGALTLEPNTILISFSQIINKLLKSN